MSSQGTHIFSYGGGHWQWLYWFNRPCCCPGYQRTDFQGLKGMILWTITVIRAAGTFVSIDFPDIFCFAITSSVFWCKSIYWLRNTSVAAYFCSKYDQGFSDEFHGLTSGTLDLSSRNGPWFPGSISGQILIQSPHRSSYGQKHGHEMSSAQHGQSNDFVSCGHWQPCQNWNHFQKNFQKFSFQNFLAQ